jgi:phosphatidylglycerol lysyltransferase
MACALPFPAPLHSRFLQPGRVIETRVSRSAFLVLRLGLLALAAWALRRELGGVHADELTRQIGSYGWRHAALAVAGTAASFAVLGLIESLALRAVVPDIRVRRRTASVTAFVAHAFSQSIGVALLTGSAVRLRAYRRDRLDAAAVARTSAFVTLSITLGLLACGGAALFAGGPALRLASVTLPTRPVAALLLLVVAAYLAWSMTASRERVGHGRWQLRRPSGRTAVAQLLLSSADWLLTAMVLYAVLPDAAGLGFTELLRAYLVAQTVGMASHVPGGAGVFEAVMLTLGTNGSATQRAAVVAALVSFRIVYYLLPLVGALIAAAIAELRPRGTRRQGIVPANDDSMVLPSVG